MPQCCKCYSAWARYKLSLRALPQNKKLWSTQKFFKPATKLLLPSFSRRMSDMYVTSSCRFSEITVKACTHLWCTLKPSTTGSFPARFSYQNSMIDFTWRLLSESGVWFNFAITQPSYISTASCTYAAYAQGKFRPWKRKITSVIFSYNINFIPEVVENDIQQQRQWNSTASFSSLPSMVAASVLSAALKWVPRIVFYSLWIEYENELSMLDIREFLDQLLSR